MLGFIGLPIYQHSHKSIDVEMLSLFSLPFWTHFVPVCYLFWTFPQIFSDVWKEMYVARDIFSLFLLHLCRKLQRRAPFWGQSGRKSFTTKTFPLPYSATAPLFPTSDDLHVQSPRCFFTAVLSTKFAVRRFCKIRSKNFCHFGKNGSYLHPQRERNVSYDSGK